MLKRVMHALIALSLITGVTASSIDTAEARRGGGRFAAGLAAGIIGLGLLGAYGRERGRYYDYAEDDCYPGPEQCGWVDRRCFENRYGDRVCRGGRWTCWRPRYCD